jgi:hypothetical protein
LLSRCEDFFYTTIEAFRWKVAKYGYMPGKLWAKAETVD